MTAVELRWRLIRDEPRTGARNMALDHALASCLGAGDGVVRLYEWSRPTVSFGKNEPGHRLLGDAGSLDHVRRPTGGRAVLHDEELTYAVVAPLDAFGGLREAYVRINEALAAALRALGVDAGLVTEEKTSRTPALDAGPCFGTPVRGEIVADGRKLVGSAQARLEGALLQHGSILIGGDQGSPEPVTLRELVGDVTADGAALATAEAFERSFGGEWRQEGYSERELRAAERLELDRYGRDSWTWRR